MELEILLFDVGGRRLATMVATVREVFRLGPLTPVPTAPPGVAGVTNLRGQVVPVLDVGELLGADCHRRGLGNPVVLLDAGGDTVGIIVERVIGITKITTEALRREEPPPAGILGGEVVSAAAAVPLLDVDRLVALLQPPVGRPAAPELAALTPRRAGEGA